MTVIEAIKLVLKNHPEGLSSADIFQEIIDKQYYSFGAKNPYGIVNGELRRHCVGLDFPTASPMKHFVVTGHDGRKLKFSIKTDELVYKPEKQINEEDPLDYLPEEKIEKAIEEHLNQIKQILIENIMKNQPVFFEHLVVALLLKMGYGYDEKSGIVTGGPHDNGIDGIISEDKLGLDLIYLQAKRYCSSNKVGRKEIQAFIGAMNHIQKGVFITTSSYTKEALLFAKNQQQKSVKLIDGDLLAAYMIKYEIGVESVKSYHIYKVNSDFFA